MYRCDKHFFSTRMWVLGDGGTDGRDVKENAGRTVELRNQIRSEGILERLRIVNIKSTLEFSARGHHRTRGKIFSPISDAFVKL